MDVDGLGRRNNPKKKKMEKVFYPPRVVQSACVEEEVEGCGGGWWKTKHFPWRDYYSGGAWWKERKYIIQEEDEEVELGWNGKRGGKLLMCFMDQNNVILLYVGSASLLLLSCLWWHGKGDTCNVYIKYTFQLEWSASVYVSLCLCCVGTVSKVNNDEEQEISFLSSSTQHEIR